MSVTIQSVRLNSLNISSEGVIPPPNNPATLTYSITSSRNVSLNLSDPGLNITIDWGDGSAPEVFTTSPQTHTYAINGTYEVSIEGNATTWGPASVKGRMSAITSWGDLPLTSLSNSCRAETALVSVPSNIPSTVTDLNSMFYDCTTFNQNLNGWDVSNVTDMSFLFGNTSAFNQPLNNWDVSGVLLFNNTFAGSGFNQDISNWDVSNATSMNNMFKNATSFNQNLMPWNTVKVAGMFELFRGASSYGATQDLKAWHVPLVPPAHITNGTFALDSLLLPANFPIPGTP